MKFLDGNILQLTEPTRGVSFEKDWYDEGGVDNVWMSWRFSVFQDFLASSEIEASNQLTVLDLGGGTGICRDQIEHHTNWVVDLVDMDLEALNNAKPGRGRKIFYDVSERHESLHEYYDGIILFDVLEHLDSPNVFLNSLVYHLKPGGFIFINVPALNVFHSAYDEAVGHRLRYERESILPLFPILQFSMIKMRYWGFTLIPLLAIRKIIVGKKLSGEKPKSDIIRVGWKPKNTIINNILKTLMVIDLNVFRNPFLGSSLMVQLKKIERVK